MEGKQYKRGLPSAPCGAGATRQTERRKNFYDGDEQLFCHLVISPVILSCSPAILSEKLLLARRLDNARIERAVRLTSTEPYSVK